MALGEGAQVTADGAVALGAGSIADVAGTVSVGSSAAQRRITNLAAGVDDTDAVNVAQLNAALVDAGGGSPFLSVNSSGDAADASGSEAIALGAVTTASGAASVAIGGDGGDANAFGARALAERAMALGSDSTATGTGASAIGYGTRADGVDATSVGNAASATGAAGTAVGRGALAGGTNTAAIGRSASATGSGATAVGTSARASQFRAVAVGGGAQATASEAVAIGSGANAGFADAVAIGSGASANAANQVTLGGAGSSVRIGDLNASTAAQVGPVDVVTVDANGTLGRQQVASVASVENVRVAMNALSMVSSAQFEALTSRVSALEFDLQDLDQRSRGGIAAAMAMGGTMIVPDSAISLSANVSTFEGEQGFSGSIAARVAQRVYISAALSGSSAPDSTGGRVGVAIGF